MNRRRFCMAVGGLGTAAIGATSFAETAQLEGVFERTANAFGTTVRLVVQHASQQTAEKAISAAWNEIEEIESLMSIYRPDSQLSQLNRQGQLISPHAFLQQVLRQANELAADTRGAFDITVQPLWQVYQQASMANGESPDSKALEQARKRVNFRNVKVLQDRIRLADRTHVTLNGIAQGFATDRVKQVLLENDVQNALIDVGELGSIGSKNGEQWRAGIQHPRQEDAYVAVTPMGHRCLATSGDYETTFTDDFRHHHIFDPRLGASPTELSSVSVLAPTAIEADALSTALLVMGRSDGIALLRKRPNVDALFVGKNGRVSATHGFSKG